MKRFSIVLLALAIMVSITGCAQTGKPTEAFNDLMAAFIDTDGAKMLEYIDDKEYAPFITYMDLPVELSNMLIDKLVMTKYVVKSETLSEDKKSAELEVEFTYFDTGSRMAAAHIYTITEISQGTMKDADFDTSQAFIAETFTKYLTNDVPEVTETHTLKLIKNSKGKWLFQPSLDLETLDPLYNIFSGNLVAYVEAVGMTTGE